MEEGCLQIPRYHLWAAKSLESSPGKGEFISCLEVERGERVERAFPACTAA